MKKITKSLKGLENTVFGPREPPPRVFSGTVFGLVATVMTLLENSDG